jgi:hypothetical protein
MNGGERRGLVVGVALVGLGVYILLARHLSFRGPGPILILIGAILLTLSALRLWRGPNVAAGVLLGLGLAFLLRDALDRWMPHWATMLLGIGMGLLLAAALERAGGRAGRPAPLAPGIVLVAIALSALVAENLRFPFELSDALWRLWPWVIVAAGAVLVVRALAARRSG